ncbi:hypothetical protein [Citrobacter freundii]|uniref:Uncharacterized protein n=1 Tax=Citrobacter freundii TaxID=546 RepID=A0A7G2IWR0_CITFR|nr:hypothetical protein [Citrobacter freundii]
MVIFFGYSHKNGKLPDNVTDKTFLSITYIYTPYYRSIM